MAIDVFGWVEFMPNVFREDDRNESYAWRGLMPVESIVDNCDEVNWILMGNPRSSLSDRKLKAIAPERGFPNNPCGELLLYIEKNSEFFTGIYKDELFGFTNFSFNEVENINWQEYFPNDLPDSDWFLLFKMITYFQQLKQISSEDIRITAWYCR